MAQARTKTALEQREFLKKRRFSRTTRTKPVNTRTARPKQCTSPFRTAAQLLRRLSTRQQRPSPQRAKETRADCQDVVYAAGRRPCHVLHPCSSYPSLPQRPQPLPALRPPPTYAPLPLSARQVDLSLPPHLELAVWLLALAQVVRRHPRQLRLAQLHRLVFLAQVLAELDPQLAHSREQTFHLARHLALEMHAQPTKCQELLLHASCLLAREIFRLGRL
eukprot:1318580-Pleurochrysis_carterae.AAC.3